MKDHTIQGWTMDKERLKKGHMFTDEYFERQLQYIREIRLSERKFDKRSRTSTLQLSTTTRMQGPLVCFSRPCRTSCIMPFIATQRQS